MSVGDLPDCSPDPWIRFDMYADMAKHHALSAVSTAAVDGATDESEPTATSKAHGWAADVFRDLATACVPKQSIRRDRP